IWLGFDHIVESLPKNVEQPSAAPAESEDEWPDQIDS
ncbi:MAG: hypothetical protein QOJ02_3180, partial [Acidobacteriota bacterium]|nr:hypothetical protein [Acidobacteriota bacterium]